MRYLGVLILAALVMIPDGRVSGAGGAAMHDRNPKPLTLLNIIPSGVDVPPGRQIVFQFNRQVVPLGRMDREASQIPISISPVVKCQWRWLNTSTLACMMDEASALAPATRYEIVVNPGIRAQDGATLKKPVRHSFTTERPKVVHAWFKTWEGPGTPDIRLTFNQPVSRRSVERHVFLRLPGKAGSRITLRVRPDADDREIPAILPLPGEKLALIAPPARPAPKGAPSKQKGQEARRVWLISPATGLPLDASVYLRVEPGLRSAAGPERGVENRVLVAFDTFPAFTFEGVQCTVNASNRVLIKADGAGDAAAPRCNPLQPVYLVFSSPVTREAVKKHVTIQPDLAGGRAGYDPWAPYYGNPSLSSPHRRGRKYRVPLPGPLKAYADYHLETGPAGLQDMFGRVLPSPIAMGFATDHRLPDFRLVTPMAVLEENADTDMALVVTNLDRVTLTYDRLTAGGKALSLKQDIDLPGVRDVAYRIPARVRKLLGGRSGVVQGTLSSVPEVSKTPGERWFYAQVTPYQVHVKLGHFNTLAWVTSLSTGKPVRGASVEICRDTYRGLSAAPQVLSAGTTDAAGTVVLSGTEKIDPQLKLFYPRHRTDPRLFVRVHKGGEMASLPLDYPFQVDTYQVSKYSIWPHAHHRYGHIHAWGTTAQGVYRAGDTIQYKFYVRDQNNETLVPAPRDGYRLTVVDPMGKTVYEEKALALSAFGAGQGEFVVPKTGAVGWYRFRLSAPFLESTLEPMRVLVSDFTPAAFHVTTDVNGRLFRPGQEMEVTTRARLHAGGPYADAAARVTVTLSAGAFHPDNPAAEGFSFDTSPPGTPRRQVLHQTERAVDDRGDLSTRFPLPKSAILYGNLAVEGAVRDDRGKYVAGRCSAAYAARDRFVGLRSTRWVLKAGKPGTVQVLVVDAEGRPVPGVPVHLSLEHQKTFAARVKGAGNAYLTQYTRRWVTTGSARLDSGGRAKGFTFMPKASGLYRVTARIEDSLGRGQSTRLMQWVAGKNEVVWEERQDSSLEIIPEKKAYRVGDTARYLVQNPFRGARALISIERYGVLKHWVQRLDSGTPVIQFKVEKEFMPGFFLSVVVVSPRVEKPLTADQVDLGKPAFRMGYVSTTVKDPCKELKVAVTPERKTYKPGEQVQVDLQVTAPPNGGSRPVELAVAVLDASVFDLLTGGRAYFDPYRGFYTVDGLDVENFSLLLQLVGRQRFELKGADAGGGGGGKIRLRSVFKFVSYWNPSILADKKGRAHISFAAPDNLTGWRVLALAVTPGDRMGLGDGHFAVNKPTEIRPVMPNQVTEGDRFQAGFSIMNRTSRPRTLTLSIAASGAVEPQAGKAPPSVTRTVAAAPYKRTVVWLPVTARGVGTITFTARGGDRSDQDGLVYVLGVHRRASLESSATYGSSVSGTVTEHLRIPKDIRTDAGGISVVLSPSVMGQLEGAFRYLRDYPYTCWEQILTRGVMAAHFQHLKRYMPDTFTWKGSERLPREMLARAAAFQTPSGAMAYYIPEDRYADPYLSAYTALAFDWLRESGYAIPPAVEEKLQAYLLRLLRKDVTPDFYSAGMASTVRAVALCALAGRGKIDAADLRRYAPHVPEMSLFGKAQFLLAAVRTPGTEDLRREVLEKILSHSDQSGGKLVFSEVIDDSYSRILASPLRTNAAILSALVAYGRTAGGAARIGDMPVRMVRTLTQTRKQSGHWENTQENMFCMNALIDYARVYESQPPDLTVQAKIDADPLGAVRFSDLRDSPVAFTHPFAPDDPGRGAALVMTRQGQGRYYYRAGISFSPRVLRTEPINAGMEIHREYSVERGGRWRLLKEPMTIQRGELVRVDLYVSLPAARNFVVVADPVPGGLEPVNRDLATSSRVDADKGAFVHAGGSWWFHYGDWSSYGVSRWSFYHRELRHDAARFYSEYLPAGNYYLSYTAQAIASGVFSVMPVHAEEMYTPDVFGQGRPGELRVSTEKASK